MLLGRLDELQNANVSDYLSKLLRVKSHSKRGSGIFTRAIVKIVPPKITRVNILFEFEWFDSHSIFRVKFHSEKFRELNDVGGGMTGEEERGN